MYLADYHIHSTGSPDGKCTIREMAEEAIRKGLQEICITDHLDTIYWDGRPRTDYDWGSALEQLREAREACGDRIVLKLGAEMGEVTQALDRAEILRQNCPPLDFVIGSVHTASAKYNWFDLYYIEPHDAAYYRDVIEGYLGEVKELAFVKKVVTDTADAIIAEAGAEFSALEKRGLLASLPVTEAGRLDEAKFTEQVTEAATEKAAQAGAGQPQGVGQTAALNESITDWAGFDAELAKIKEA